MKYTVKKSNILMEHQLFWLSENMNQEIFLDFIKNTLEPKVFMQEYENNKSEYRNFLPKTIISDIETLNIHNIKEELALIKKINRWYRNKIKSKCECSLWNEKQKIPILGWNLELIHNGFKEIKRLTNWLVVIQCKRCRAYWYEAFDSIDDDFYMQKLMPSEVFDILKNNTFPKHYIDHGELHERFWSNPD